MRRIRNRHRDAARTPSIWSSSLVVRRRPGLERWNRLNRHRSLRQQIEKLRQPRLHLLNVLRKIIHNRLRRSRNILRVRLDFNSEALKVLIPIRLGQRRHRCSDTIHFFQPDRVNLRSREIRRSESPQCSLIPPFAARQALNRKRSPRIRNVVRRNERGELLVRRKYFVLKRCVDLIRQTFFVSIRERRRKLLQRNRERISSHNSLALPWTCFRNKPHNRQVVLHTCAQNVLRLLERLRNLVQTRDVVLIMLHRIERHRERKIGQPRMNAAHPADRHLVLFQVVVLHPLLGLKQKQIVRYQVLLRKTGRVDRLDLRQIGYLEVVLMRNRSQRIVPKLIVIPVVSNRSCARRVQTQRGLP